MTKDEALKLALKALEDLIEAGAEDWSEQRPCVRIGREVITAIKEALAQPEQGPVAWMLGDDDFQDARCYVGVDGDIPLFTSPPQRQPLSLEQYDAGLLNDFGGGNVDWWQDYIRSELDRAHDFYQSQAAHGIGDKT